MLFSLSNESNLGLILTLSIGSLIEILLIIFFIYSIRKIKFHNSLTANVITYSNNIFTIHTPYETVKINKSQITRVVYKLKHGYNYGTLYICYLDKEEMLITLKNVVDVKCAQLKIEHIAKLKSK